jgi:hypothetical protein
MVECVVIPSSCGGGGGVLATTDTVDQCGSGALTPGDLVFESGTDEERSPWPFCGSKVPRSEAIFIVKVALVFTVVAFCIVRLSITESCEESTVYIAVLSGCITYLIPPPQRHSSATRQRNE